jgi:tripartite-type tricarboxylate transporter receptor subunit TctC
LQSDSVKLGLKRVGVSPLSGTVADADAFIRSESERWGKAVRAANVQLD